MEAMPEDAAIEGLVQRLLDDVDRIAELMLAAHRREIPDLPADEDIQAAMGEAARADLRAAFTAFRLDQRPQDELTYETGNLARRAARARISLPTLLRLFRIGQRIVWREICSALDEVIPDPAEREGALRLATDLMLRGGDIQATLQADEYRTERDRAMRSSAQARLAVVQQLLADPTADASSLGYDLEAEHIAVVASGAGAESALRAGARGRRLIARAGPDVVWAWFGTDPGEQALAGVPGVRVDIGGPGSGRDGFVTSHVQARAAHALGAARNAPVTGFETISLEWLETRDRPAAERIVVDEFGALITGEGDRGPRLLDTLEAYLEAGYNASSMAARLGISVRTASYRIRSAGELLGRTIASRNAELHTERPQRPAVELVRDAAGSGPHLGLVADVDHERYERLPELVREGLRFGRADHRAEDQMAPREQG